MPVPNARAFLRRKIEPGPSREEGLAVLKEKLLMLAAQKNHDEEQTKIVELCSTISIDDNESVDNFIVEAQRVRCMEENLLVALTSEAFEDVFEVVNLDPTPEEEDERFYNEDATISEAEEPDVNEIMLGRRARVTSDYIFHHKIWDDESKKRFIVKVPHEYRQDDPTSDTTPVNTADITHDVPASDAMSVNTAATTTHKLASITTKLVSSKAKLTTAQAKLKAGVAKQTTANAKRFLEYRAEKIKRKEVANNERVLKKMSEAAVNSVLKEEAQKKKAAKAAAEAAVNAVLKEEAQKLLKQKEVEKVQAASMSMSLGSTDSYRLITI